MYVGFVASSKAEIYAAYAAALQSGAVDNGASGAIPKNCNRSPRSWTFLIACSTLMTGSECAGGHRGAAELRWAVRPDGGRVDAGVYQGRGRLPGYHGADQCLSAGGATWRPGHRGGGMLLPGVGWDLVPTDSLAMQVARRVQEPHTLRIAFPTASCWRRSRPIGCWIRLILCRNQQIKRPPRH